MKRYLGILQIWGQRIWSANARPTRNLQSKGMGRQGQSLHHLGFCAAQLLASWHFRCNAMSCCLLKTLFRKGILHQEEWRTKIRQPIFQLSHSESQVHPLQYLERESNDEPSKQHPNICLFTVFATSVTICS